MIYGPVVASAPSSNYGPDSVVARHTVVQRKAQNNETFKVTSLRDLVIGNPQRIQCRGDSAVFDDCIYILSRRRTAATTTATRFREINTFILPIIIIIRVIGAHVYILRASILSNTPV